MTLRLYLLKTVAGAVGLIWLLLSGLMLVIGFVERAADLLQSSGGWQTTLLLAAFGFVEQAHQVLPMASFLGVLVGLTVLAQRGELLAVYAAGIPVRYLALTLVFLGLVLSAVQGGMSEWAAPRASAVADQIRREELGYVDRLTRSLLQRSAWYKEGDVFYYLPEVRDDGARIERPMLYEAAGGQLRRMLEAERLRFVDGAWVLERGRSVDLQTGRSERFETQAIELQASPAVLQGLGAHPRHLLRSEIKALVAQRERAGLDVRLHQVELAWRQAYTWWPLGLLLVALPWGLRPGRRRSMAVTLGAGAAFLGVFLAAAQALRLAALSAALPAMLASWAVVLGLLPVAAASLWWARRTS